MSAKINTAALELLIRAAKHLTSASWPIPSSWTDEDWELLNTSIWMAEQTLEKEDTNASVDSK